MIIRKVVEADIPQVIAIEAANFPEPERTSDAAFYERSRKTASTFLVARQDDEILGFIEGQVRDYPHVTDDLFETVHENPEDGGYILVTSLAVHPAFQNKSVGSGLLMILQEIAKEQGRLGIGLTCHEELIAYYEGRGFTNEGLSDSKHAGAVWYDMVWRLG